MTVELRGKGVRITRELRRHVERQMRAALRRFGGRIRRLHVQLQDLNGPRGGEDIRCRIHAQLAPAQDIVVHETRDNPFAAVVRASDRLGHACARRLGRLRDRSRGRCR